jgi:hypothetical protein
MPRFKPYSYEQMLMIPVDLNLISADKRKRADKSCSFRRVFLQAR